MPGGEFPSAKQKQDLAIYFSKFAHSYIRKWNSSYNQNIANAPKTADAVDIFNQVLSVLF